MYRLSAPRRLVKQMNFKVLVDVLQAEGGNVWISSNVIIGFS